ncbi:MAG: ABC transporter permease [Ramlibacter sp.]|nr:ABC transporter permease [Ramlibacter sp.]
MSTQQVSWRAVAFWRVAILVTVLAVWEWGFAARSNLPWLIPEFLDPYFVSRPSEIWAQFLRMSCLESREGVWIASDEQAFAKCLSRSENNLWIATLVTLRNTFWGFAIGVGSGFLAGLVLGRSRFLARVFSPYIIAFNSIPRIALVPLIIMIFGLGDASKIVSSLMIVFFLVFFNTYNGVLQTNQDLINVSKLLGASKVQQMMKVVIPSAAIWVFSSLTPAFSYSLIGVVVGEFIGAERGLGRVIIEAEGRGSAPDMMVAILTLMIIGGLFSKVIDYVQTLLIRGG